MGPLTRRLIQISKPCCRNRCYRAKMEVKVDRSYISQYITAPVQFKPYNHLISQFTIPGLNQLLFCTTIPVSSKDKNSSRVSAPQLTHDHALEASHVTLLCGDLEVGVDDAVADVSEQSYKEPSIQ